MVILLHYYKWYVASAPLWLIRFGSVMQRYLWHLFSISMLSRTLFAPWHRDKLAYVGSLNDRITALLMNMVSRGVGFVVRTGAIMFWLVCSVLVLFLSVASILLFLVWPILALGAIAWGLMSLASK